MASKLKIESNPKSVKYTEKELKAAAQIGVDLPALKYCKVHLPDAILQETEEAFQEVLDNALARVAKATSLIDGQNGEGYTETIISMHKVICSLFSGKMQSKAAKVLAVKQGLIPADVLEKDEETASFSNTADDIEMDI